MPGLNLYTSNRSEILVDHLAEIIGEHPLSAFIPETIVVQSRGMARWLTMKLADRLEIWANGHFPFPNHFISDISGKLIPEPLDTDLYERDKGVWRIMTLLEELADHPLFAPLRSYRKNILKRYQLARKTADLFDQYIIYRPDFIADWDQGGCEHWQAELWYQLGRRYQQSHRAGLRDRLLSCLEQQDVSHLLPARISVFGISSLPPFHLSIFEGLGRQTEINFFLINPCRQWWGHIMDEGRIARKVKRERKSAEELYLEKGNSLLASMGYPGRDFLALLQELEAEELEDFEDPGDDTMLALVQRDILDLSESEEGSVAADDSIVFNSCHSPMREIEVLHNHLLRLFEDDPDLEPRDIVVMAPDINPYSPLVQAVFDAVRDSDRYIPYNIGDRGRNLENSLVPVFLSFLDLAGSRFEAGRILDILFTRQVRRKFELSREDLEVIRNWMKKASIRWGRDREHLRTLGLPLFDQYCWRSGIDRLLLGVCMAGEGVFGSLAPFAEMEEGDTDLLARTLEALTTVFARVRELEKEWTLAEWAAALEKILDECLEVSHEEEKDLQAIRLMVREIGLQGEELSFTEKMPLEVIREMLERKCNDNPSASGYLGGGVTFCSLLPMRAVPFKIVCLLGMNDGSFPRIQARINFDLIAENPRPGDRSPRLDDRYLFLEALISARKQFYISYAGQSVYDGSEEPPSVLVDELLDYLGRLTCTTGKNGERQLPDFITRHRLQPFHPDYFQPQSRLYSYSLTDWEAAGQFLGRNDNGPSADFWRDLPLSPEQEGRRRGDGVKEVTFRELSDFFIHPVRYFCRNRLGVDLSRNDTLPEDEEPLKLEGLNLYQLGVEMTRLKAGEFGGVSFEELFRARGQLPPGEAGNVALSRLQIEMTEFGKRLEVHDSPVLKPLDFEITCGPYSLGGTFTNLRRNGFIQARPARIKGKDILRGWLNHLVLCILAESDHSLTPSTVVIGKEAEMVFGKVSSARDVLSEIIDLFLENDCRPLPFFSETSHVFAREMLVGKPYKAGEKAEKEWLGNERVPGEGNDPWLKFRYQQQNPLDREFEELALKIFEPVYEFLSQ